MFPLAKTKQKFELKNVSLNWPEKIGKVKKYHG